VAYYSAKHTLRYIEIDGGGAVEDIQRAIAQGLA
jgi:hypothetical protein